MKKVTYLYFILLVLIYVFLVFGFIEFFLHFKKDKLLLYSWLISFFFNVACIIMSNFVKKKKPLKFTIYNIVFFNFVLLALLDMFRIPYLFQYLLNIKWIIGIYLTIVMHIIITGNWLLPLLYYYGTEIRDDCKERYMRSTSKFKEIK